MDDSLLTKVSLIAALAGIGGLLIAATSLEPAATTIAEIDNSDSGRIVEIEGSVISVSRSEGTYFLTVSDGAKIKAVIFESVARKLPEVTTVSKGDFVRLTGQVAVYRGKPEVIVQALKILSK